MRPRAEAPRSRESNYRPARRRFTMLIERREVNVNPHSVYLDARVIASCARRFMLDASRPYKKKKKKKEGVTRAMWHKSWQKSSLEVLGKRNVTPLPRLTARIYQITALHHHCRLSVKPLTPTLIYKRIKKKVWRGTRGALHSGHNRSCLHSLSSARARGGILIARLPCAKTLRSPCDTL